MKESLADRERAVVANDQSPVIAQPADSAAGGGPTGRLAVVKLEILLPE